MTISSIIALIYGSITGQLSFIGYGIMGTWIFGASTLIWKFTSGNWNIKCKCDK